MLIILSQVVGGVFLDDSVASGRSTTLPLDDVKCVDVAGKVFCFTGALTSGSRRECARRVVALDGVFSNSVTMKLDYLVVGPVASRDWFNTSYGRKIEKAVRYRDEKGLDIKIISEEVWLSSLK